MEKSNDDIIIGTINGISIFDGKDLISSPDGSRPLRTMRD
jgi:hypothetical protein